MAVVLKCKVRKLVVIGPISTWAALYLPAAPSWKRDQLCFSFDALTDDPSNQTMLFMEFPKLRNDGLCDT